MAGKNDFLEEDLVNQEEFEDSEDYNPALDMVLEEHDLLDYFKSLPIWIGSIALHLVIMAVLATYYFTDKKEKVEIISQPTQNESIDTDSLLDEDMMDMADLDVEVQDVDAVAQPVSTVFTNVETVQEIRIVDTYETSETTDMIEPMDQMTMTNPLSGRLKGKGQLLRMGGGTNESERAVKLALAWIAKQQREDGSWSFKQVSSGAGTTEAVNASTALALLPFLGAGHTPTQGDYKETVAKGLEFLIKNGTRSPDGLDLRDSGEGRMYSHGIAAIALCEAWAMGASEKNKRYNALRGAAQQAIAFIINAQDPNAGGWRYAPKDPGDTSVTGWQLMALKSGMMGGLAVDTNVMKKAQNFLVNQVAYDNGSGYGYVSNNRHTNATTAIGLLCRLYLDWTPQNPSLIQGANMLLQAGPEYRSPYCIYYATQVLHHIGGPQWTQWNNQVRDTLVQTQIQGGSEEGSWDPKLGDGYTSQGGSLYITALYCMTLEVYYRHMPLYAQFANDEEANQFPLE